jgi:methyl-accepting chemotaxis protein
LLAYQYVFEMGLCMGDWFAGLRVRNKLLTIIVASAVGMVLLQFISLGILKENLLLDREVKTRHIAEAAYGILEFYNTKQIKGELSQAEAQALAKESIRAMRYEGDQYLWINDMQPAMIMHPTNPGLEGKSLEATKDANGIAIFKDMVAVVKANGKGFVAYQWNKPNSNVAADKISYVIGFKAWDWILGTGIYIDDIEEIFWSNVSKSALYLLGIMLVVGLIASVITQSLVSQISKLKLVMTKTAEAKDLTSRVKNVANNEIGEIGSAFNNMLDSFQSSMLEIRDDVRLLSGASQALASVATQTNDGVQRQHLQIDQVATAMEEMSSTVHEVSENITETATATEVAYDEASRGAGIAKATKEAIDRLSLQVNQSAEAVNGLEKDSKDIGSILDVIRGIAEQTNLLALNAAIEAARAGEQGRGFAVVADEVRGLAKRTQDSIEEIESMIARLQDRARKTAKEMQDGKNMSIASAEQIASLSISLEKIDSTVAIIKQMSMQIATSAEEQAAVANEISSSITRISGIAESTSGGANQTNISSGELAKLAEKLTAVVTRFVV